MLIGNKDEFAIGYEIVSRKDRVTALCMYVNRKNILEFKVDGERYTVTWNLDDLVTWLEEFAMKEQDEPFPYEVKGATAAEKDSYAREYDSDSDAEFESYYERLNEWVYVHTWKHASAGGTIPNVYFRKIGHEVEISWDNNDVNEVVTFLEKDGSVRIDADKFKEIIWALATSYKAEWSGASMTAEKKYC